MPAGPGIEQLFGVAVLGHDVAELLQIFTACGSVWTIFPSSVGALEAGGNAGELFALFGIRRGGEGEGEFQDFELAGGDGIEAEAIEAGGFLGVVDSGIDGALVEFGGDSFGIAGDVGGFDPIGAAGIGVEGEELSLGIVGELARLVGRGFPAGAGGKGEQGEEAEECPNLHEHTVTNG